MSLQIYNTMTKKVEPFKSIEPGKVSMYVCGPTVYDFLHVGNFRGAVFFNMVRNWLERSGYEVKFVYNYTDVDDKIIKRANEEGTFPLEISERYIEEFEKDFSALGLKKHEKNPKVTDCMEQIVKTIRDLVDAGKAYEVDGEVIYSIDAFPEYGKLSGKNLDELEAGTRVEVDDKKKNPLDFVLWKPSKEGEPHWSSPWGEGRPGWHIECTCMIHNELGEEIDIHGGGIDLIFPHHENEIAQGSGVSGKSYVKYWMHHNFIKFDNEKMSKSLGNVIKGRDFMEEYHPEVLKFLYLSVHYRSLINFAESQIEQSMASLARIYTALELADRMLDGVVDVPACEPSFIKELDALKKAVEEAMDDDFNTSVVFAKVFEAVRIFNSHYKLGKKINPQHQGRAQAFKVWMQEVGGLMALFSEDPSSLLIRLDDIFLKKKSITRKEVDGLVESRSEARKNKDFQKSDELRDKLVGMGIEILDTPQGTIWTVNKSIGDNE